MPAFIHTECLSLENGETLYFNLIGLKHGSAWQGFWDSYLQKTSLIGKEYILNGYIYNESEKIAILEKCANQCEHKDIINIFLKQRQVDSKKLASQASGLSSGLAGAADSIVTNMALDENSPLVNTKNANWFDKKQRYVAFISKKPAKELLAQYNEDSPIYAGIEQELQFYLNCYSNIVMSVGVVTEKGSPSITNMGIIKNPVYFLENDTRYRGISIELIGFAAEYMMKNENKHLMVNMPTPAMQQIMAKQLGSEHMLLLDDPKNEKHRQAKNDAFNKWQVPETFLNTDLDHCKVGFNNTVMISLSALAMKYQARKSPVLQQKQEWIVQFKQFAKASLKSNVQEKDKMLESIAGKIKQSCALEAFVIYHKKQINKNKQTHKHDNKKNLLNALSVKLNV